MISRRWARAALLLIAVCALPAAGEAGSITITWDPNTELDVAGYSVHYGTQSGTYAGVIDAGNRTTLTIPNLVDGRRYYLAVRAYSAAGVASSFSAEVSALTPVPSPTTGLVAAYGFEESSGSAINDASPNGNHGVIAGATRTGSGRYGRALSFDGVDDVITIADSASLDLSTEVTIQAWVRPSTLTGFQSVLMKEAPEGLAYALYANDSTSKPAAHIRLTGMTDSDSSAGTTGLTIGSWTHLAATFDGATLRFYVNGALIESRAVSGTVQATAGALRLGGNTVWGEYFGGVIDEVRIYSRALPAAEIARDMNAPVSSGLVAAFGFEETTGTVASDASGRGNNGTIQGATRASGRFGRALSFDGVNDVVTVADAATLDSPHVTVSAWVLPTTLSGWRTAVMKEAAAGVVYGLYAHDNAPNPAMTVGMSGVDHSASGAAPLPLNTWSHLAATYDGATVRLFVNGTQVSTKAISGTLAASANPLRIGGNSLWVRYFSGTIDEVRVYNRALSAAEISADMNRAVAP